MPHTAKIKVKINAERPDFRVFSAYFFGNDCHNYDSEGNSYEPYSRTWTELYMCCRANSDLQFNIDDIDQEPLIFEVSAKTVEIVHIVAYFLAKETKGEILDEKNHVIPLESLLSKMGNFDLSTRLKLAENSIWRKSSVENPYPNLENR
jgi:hypothetical protein